ncbi:hypothetical protein J7M22_03600 [Candidatus Poribacteria bacterium]|nr:hypothetical protein [Candidatus Poribacteria bacterium]
MDRMRVVGLILGSHGTSPDSIDRGNPSFKPTPIPESVKEEIREGFIGALPKDVDFDLMEVTGEHQLIEPIKADAYVVFPFQSIHDRWLHALYSHNKPLVIATLPLAEVFSYGNVYYPYFIRDAREIDERLGLRSKFFLSRNWDDLSLLLRAIEVDYKLRHTRAVCIGEPMYEPFHSPEWGYAMVRLAQEKFGLTWLQMSSESFINLWNGWRGEIDISDIKGRARNIYGLDDEALGEAKKMYLILRSILEGEEANALTINCLASIILRRLNVTPCYALSLLNDEGIPAACEADTTTLVDMLITVYASNSPGFMVNPYLFPADNRLLVSHCTSPTLHRYGDIRRDEFDLRTHFESNLGVAPQVFKEAGERVTITGISHDSLDKMLIISGEIEENTLFSTCRSQVIIRVNDAKEIAESYQGRHWIVVYGDHREMIGKANEVLGIQSVML